MSAPAPPRAAHARLFVVCGLGVSASELASLFGAFGELRDVRVVADKGVAYVTFASAAHAEAAIERVTLEREGARDPGGVATCRKFLGGCERVLRVMLASDADPVADKNGPGNGPGPAVETRATSAGGEPPDALVPAAPRSAPARRRAAEKEKEKETPARKSPGPPPARNAEPPPASPAVDPDDDPPRSRLFVVCPKGVSQDRLRDAFLDLIRDEAEAKARATDAAAAADANPSANNPSANNPSATGGDSATTDGPGADEDTAARVGGEDKELHPRVASAANRGAASLSASDLEYVRVVPHKGVAFAKFASAEAAALCLEAVARSLGDLGGVRVKCMLAEPKAHTRGKPRARREAGPRVRSRAAILGSPRRAAKPRRGTAGTGTARTRTRTRARFCPRRTEAPGRDAAEAKTGAKTGARATSSTEARATSSTGARATSSTGATPPSPRRPLARVPARGPLGRPGGPRNAAERNAGGERNDRRPRRRRSRRRCSRRRPRTRPRRRRPCAPRRRTRTRTFSRTFTRTSFTRTSFTRTRPGTRPPRRGRRRRANAQPGSLLGKRRDSSLPPPRRGSP